MIEKNRGNEVILEMVEALKNKNFEFPRAHYLYRRQSKETKKSSKINSRTSCGTITATQLFYF